MAERVKNLKKIEIYKSMKSLKKPGLWQDVYHTNDGDTERCIKLQKSRDGKAIIISFKEK
ncbi:MAG: hypothetical protein B6245_06550 [Desulfobacteraceae bacterium 4572_88]|nr:MAG: hypothetical protein B6245_06550 [Desulfobacteraceae bacterium 4572_88]